MGAIAGMGSEAVVIMWSIGAIAGMGAGMGAALSLSMVKAPLDGEPESMNSNSRLQGQNNWSVK